MFQELLLVHLLQVGFFRGDVITMLQYRGDKYEIYEVDDFKDALEQFKSGKRVAIHLNRKGSKFITSVKIN